MKKFAAIFSLLLAGCGEKTAAPLVATAEPDGTVIYPAAMIHTLDVNRPDATAVAVKEGRITGVGSLQEMTASFPAAVTDNSFSDKVIVPGLIDPHMHVLLGSVLYALPFATPWPMAGPEGEIDGYPTRGAFLDRLSDIVANASEDDSPVFIYGYHNLIQGDLTRLDLDAIASDRPVLVWHYSGHDFYLNTAALEMARITPALHDEFEGIGLLPDGSLSGRVFEDALPYLFQTIGPNLFNPLAIARGANDYFTIMQDAGITTTADLAYGAFDRAIEDSIIASTWSLEKTGFRLYLVPEFRGFEGEFGDGAPDAIRQMLEGEIKTPAPVLPRVKFFTDGAFYSQTMRLSPPGYLAGQSSGTEGLWVLQPDEIANRILPYWSTGLDVHIHSNGDAAQTASLRALDVLRETSADQDYVIEHGGLFSPAQVAEAARLDAMVSAASHYVFYLSGNYAKPLGPQRAAWISPLGSLTEAGVSVTVHSDAPLAPPQPLRAAGVHITRATREGPIYQPGEALSPDEALGAITLDAAKILGLEGDLGSIEPGKYADFTILAADPLSLSGEQWADIEVIGTVLAGEMRLLAD